jgi:hypothetical protein
LRIDERVGIKPDLKGAQTAGKDNDAKTANITTRKYAAQYVFFFASLFGVSVERGFQSSADAADFTHATEGEEPQKFFFGGGFFVERNEGFGLCMVHIETLAHGRFLVVIALDQRLTGDVILASDAWWFVLDVINAT